MNEQETVMRKVMENGNTNIGGGIQGIAASLKTNLETGINGDETDLHRRRQLFGSNNTMAPHAVPAFNFRRLMADAVKDSTVVLLLCCAGLSLVLGIEMNGLEEGILDGVMVLVVISSVVSISSLIKLLLETRAKFTRTSSRRSSRTAAVRVLRDGRPQQVAPSEVVVGDVVCLQAGDQVPADGVLYIGGKSLELEDEENDSTPSSSSSSSSCRYNSVFTGAKVVAGDGCMLVTAVGENTETGKMMKLTASNSRKESKLLIEVGRMSSRLEKFWLSLTLIVLLVKVLRCTTEVIRGSDDDDDNAPADAKGLEKTVQQIIGEATRIMNSGQGGGGGAITHYSSSKYIQMLSVLVFVVRDGLLPLELLICLLYASKMLPSYGAVARNLLVCGSLGSVTTIICSGETSDLSLDHTKMADLWIGSTTGTGSLLFIESSSALDGGILDALRVAIVTIMADDDDDDAVLLVWAKRFLGVDREKMMKQENFSVEASDIRNSHRAGFLLRWNDGHASSIAFNVCWRGSPEMILAMCSHYYDMHGNLQTLEDKRYFINNSIKEITEVDDDGHDLFRCVAFACKQVDEQNEDEDQNEISVLVPDRGLTWLGLVRLKKKPSTDDHQLKEAIDYCEESGVKIKLLLEDDISTARLTAIKSGILKRDHDDEASTSVVEASVFRNSSEKSRSLMVDNIRVLANASPLDKLLMVQSLRQKGEVVAVTGMRTRDAPSLKEADVGVLVTDQRSAQVAKENSDIVVLQDKGFATIVSSLKWGRCFVFDNIRKLVQLHLTVNISALTVNLVAAIFLSGGPVIDQFQLLWVNTVMDVLGALALAACSNSPASRQWQQQKRSPALASPLITTSMCRNITVLVLYQVCVVLLAHFKGEELLQANQAVLKAIVCNSFAICQVFVLMNAGEIESSNVFEGKTLHQNVGFLVILGFICCLDVAIIEAVAVVTRGTRLGLKHWCVCFGIAVVSLPIGLSPSVSPDHELPSSSSS